MPFAVGGGIKSIKDIEQIIKSGAEKVIISTHAIKNPNFIKEASNFFGSQLYLCRHKKEFVWETKIMLQQRVKYFFL